MDCEAFNGQEANAGDADPQALSSLLVKIQPYLTSLLQDLASWNADRLAQQPRPEQLVPISSETDDETAMKGNWGDAKAFVDKYPDYVNRPITIEQATVLHCAAAAKRANFVEEVLKLMTPKDLELKTKDGLTALHVAAKTGVVRIAEEMVKKNRELPLIHDGNESTPLHVAAFERDRNMVDYLLSVTPFSQLTTTRQRIHLLLDIVSAGFYDIALIILKNDTHLATADSGGAACGRRRALEELARNPLAIGSETAKVGNVEFLIIIIRSYPDLLWQLVDEEHGISLFHNAIMHRQKSVFNLIYEIGAMKEKITTYVAKCCSKKLDIAQGDNMLHIAGKLAPSDRLNTILTEALQIEKEFLWFQETENIMPPSYVNMKNIEGEIPRDIFKKKHQNLHEEGEKWMKKTANNCILVATLIATVVFAALFTVPGDNNHETKKHDTGKPLLLHNDWFTVFFISDTIALVFSSTSILVFLSITTSRYRDEDFLKTIPVRLLGGLAALFISITGMVSAFSATCFLVYYSKTP
ncbi:ankyrin repeat-containing protein NPR4-like [Corylus avellana]|uniref:ankyrin repeat-containing protein NPR4-like n=1 Tax=Corylus avellana TaxID=13451 RepID=UPI00286C45B6|nr:ankyrin repeat-containing protein NPR4-like [Corylus avellana]